MLEEKPQVSFQWLLVSTGMWENRVDTWPLDPLSLAHNSTCVCRPGSHLVRSCRKQRVLTVVVLSTLWNTRGVGEAREDKKRVCCFI